MSDAEQEIPIRFFLENEEEFNFNEFPEECDLAVLEPFPTFAPLLRDIANAPLVKKGEKHKIVSPEEFVGGVIFTVIAAPFIWVILMLILLPISLILSFLWSETIDMIQNWARHEIIILSLFLSSTLMVMSARNDYIAKSDYFKVILSHDSKRVIEFMRVAVGEIADYGGMKKTAVMEKLLQSPQDLEKLDILYQSGKDMDFWKRQMGKIGIHFENYQAPPKPRPKPDIRESLEYQTLCNHLSDIRKIIQSTIGEHEAIPFNPLQTLDDRQFESLEEVRSINIQLDTLIKDYWQCRLNHVTMTVSDLSNAVNDKMAYRKSLS